MNGFLELNNNIVEQLWNLGYYQNWVADYDFVIALLEGLNKEV